MSGIFGDRWVTAIGHVTLACVAVGVGALVYYYWDRISYPVSTESYTSQNKRRKKGRPQKPVYQRQCSVNIVTTADEWDRVYQKLCDSLSVLRMVGFDCEWVTRGRIVRPVALVQIATDDGFVILVRMSQLDKIPDSFVDFLADKSIVKVGVAVNDDASRLYKDYRLCVKGCVDLRHAIKRVRCYQFDYLGLDGLAYTVLDRQLEKNFKIRCGNWEVDSLSEKQVEYAAYDALAAVDIFVQLVLAKIYKKAPPVDARSKKHVNEISKMAMSVSQGLVDLPYKNEKVKNTEKKIKPQTSYQKQKREASLSYSTRNKPLYHNCRLVAPDDQLLCTTSLSKIQWYLDKGLADKVNEDPLTVKLRFEPSGRPEGEDNYYLLEKDNVCVACGSDDSYIRKLVVPHEYRKYFPDVMKEHLSHDVLLLCPKCHAISSLHDGRFRQFLVTKCSAPLNSGSKSRTIEDSELMKVRSAARALTQSYNKIPQKRREVLENEIMSFFGVSEMSDDLIQLAMNVEVRLNNGAYVAHGEKVVSYYRDNEGLIELERLWRQHFVDTMQPAFLPPLWSVDHNHDRMASLAH